ncbi:MAG: hypothetical protein JXB35_02250 [Anaerolineae bacterium]|nr:hypothetical protein [Anaerolineae bacterium]
MTKRRVAISVLGMLVLLSLACTFSRSLEFDMGASTGRSFANFDDETDVRIVTFDFPATAEQGELDFEIDVTSGSASWTLTDPTGEIRAQGALGEGVHHYAESWDFDPVVGEWVLALNLERASGQYTAAWKAK